MLKKILRHIRHRVIDAPRGFGHPVPAAAFDDEYRSGHWQLLDTADEQERYLALAKLIQTHTTHPELLDAGCGTGRLAHFLGGLELAAYHGVDLSMEAIRQAEKHPPAKAVFMQADLETWHPTQTYDVIVANEVIGYFKDPVATLVRLAQSLRPNGRLIVSLYRWGNATAIWRRVHTRFHPITSVSVANRHGDKVWDLKVISLRSKADY